MTEEQLQAITERIKEKVWRNANVMFVVNVFDYERGV